MKKYLKEIRTILQKISENNSDVDRIYIDARINNISLTLRKRFYDKASEKNLTREEKQSYIDACRHVKYEIPLWENDKGN